MWLKTIFILITLTLQVTGYALNVSTTSNLTMNEDERLQLIEAGQNTTKFVESMFQVEHIDSMIAFATTLSDFAEMVGPAFSIFSRILSGVLSQDRDDEMRNFIHEQFEKVHERFDHIELELANVIRLIKTEVFNHLYEQKRQYIANVRYGLATYFENPSLTNLANARLACNSQSANPLTIIRHFYDRIVRGIPPAGQMSFTDTLIETVTEYDFHLLRKWTGQVISDVIEAGILRCRCLGLESDEDFNESQRKVDAKAVTEKTREIISHLNDTLARAVQTFDKNQLEKDVRRNITAQESPAEIAQHIFALVMTKYSFFDWYIFAWEGGEYYLSPKNHRLGIHHVQINQTDQKNIVLVWKKKGYARNPRLRAALRNMKNRDYRTLMVSPGCIEYLNNPFKFQSVKKIECAERWQPNITEINHNAQLLADQQVNSSTCHSSHRLILKHANVSSLISNNAFYHVKGLHESHVVMFVECSPATAASTKTNSSAVGQLATQHVDFDRIRRKTRDRSEST